MCDMLLGIIGYIGAGCFRAAKQKKPRAATASSRSSRLRRRRPCFGQSHAVGQGIVLKGQQGSLHGSALLSCCRTLQGMCISIQDGNNLSVDPTKRACSPRRRRRRRRRRSNPRAENGGLRTGTSGRSESGISSIFFSSEFQNFRSEKTPRRKSRGFSWVKSTKIEASFHVV